MKKKQKKIALAESCTGGLLAKMLTDIPGSSECFLAGWVTYSNEAKIKQLGIPEDLILHYGAVSEPVARMMAIQAADKSGADIAVAITGIAGPDGGTRWIAARGKVVRGPDGKPVRLRGVSMDVTARRRDEAELQRQREGLAQLQRASAVGQLSIVLAHELNQPLGAILRNAEAAELLLQKESPDLAELRNIVADIHRDDRRAATVIDRMRALLRRRSLQFETVGLRDLIAQVVGLVQPEVKVRRAKLEFSVPDELPDIRGDRVHLQQVLLNLLLNSLEAVRGLPGERRRLTIDARQRDDGQIEVAVRDRGPGFPVEQISSVFDPFVTTKIGGTGLGLAISKTIVEWHGGRIWAENDPQGGATVRFRVDAAQDGGTV